MPLDTMSLRNKIILLVFLTAIFLTITVGVLTHNHLLESFDAHAANAFGAIHSPSLDALMLSITKLGNTYQSLSIFLVLSLYLIAKRKKYSFYIFTVATSLATLLPSEIKILVARPRPLMHLLYQSGFSFPSEHATLAAVYLLSAIFLIVPLLKGRFLKILWLSICGITFPLLALSRIYLSVHFASDVLAGIVLGSACFVFALTVIRHHRSYRR